VQSGGDVVREAAGGLRRRCRAIGSNRAMGRRSLLRAPTGRNDVRAEYTASPWQDNAPRSTRGDGAGGDAAWAYECAGRCCAGLCGERAQR